MSIIKSNTDNKIKRALSGEILLKNDAYIDLRSTYGVTKNVSNEVEKVRLVNAPYSLKAVNTPCIENGDGFDFSANTSGHLTAPNIPDLDDFTFQFWYKRIVDGAYDNVLSYNNGAGIYFLFQISNTARLALFSNNYSSSNLGEVESNDWVHIAYCKEGSVLNGYINGYSQFKLYSLSGLLSCDNKKGQIGNRVDLNYPFENYIDDIELLPYAKYKVGESSDVQVFTPPERSSDND